MILTLIHGNALGSISDKIIDIKKNFVLDEISEFNAKNDDFNLVLLEVATPQLFSQTRLIILENYEEKLDIDKLSIDPEVQIIFRFSKELSAKNFLLEEIKKRKGQIILLSEKDEKRVFKFLDYLTEKDKKVFSELEKLYDEFGGQYILTMIFFQLRKFITPNSNLPSFVLQKLDNQKKFFNYEKILNTYRDVLETDYKIKSGEIDDKTALTLLINRIIST